MNRCCSHTQLTFLTFSYSFIATLELISMYTTLFNFIIPVSVYQNGLCVHYTTTFILSSHHMYIIMQVPENNWNKQNIWTRSFMGEYNIQSLFVNGIFHIRWQVCAILDSIMNLKWKRIKVITKHYVDSSVYRKDNK